MKHPLTLGFDSWTPPIDHLEPADRPQWVRLSLDGLEFCNYLNKVDWRERPLILQSCELCGEPLCGRGDLCDLVRLRNAVCFLKWPMHPDYRRILTEDVWFSIEQWSELRRHAPQAPEWEGLPAISNGQVLSLWLASAPPALAIKLPADLARAVKNRFLAAESMEPGAAKAHLESRARRLILRDGAPSSWEVVELTDEPEALETIWLESPDSDIPVAWPVWLRDDPNTLVIGCHWALKPVVAEPI
ncbi:MAG: hypothetical protein ACKV19_13535 [Verrucomicrobiales bacterium]